jgi:hypothetical protein
MDHTAWLLLFVSPALAVAGMGAAVHGRIRLGRYGAAPRWAWARYVGGMAAVLVGLVGVAAAVIRLV